VSGGSAIGTGDTFLPTGYNNLTVGTYTYYAECSVGGCISGRTPVVLTITEGAPAPTVPDVAVCEGEEVSICLSLVDDGILPANIFVSPPNSSSASSQIPVGADGCAVIASGDEGYVSGTYSVIYVDGNGCTSQPGEGTVTINPLPQAPVIETVCVCDGEDAGFTIANADAGSTYSCRYSF